MTTTTVTSQLAYEKALAASAPGDTIVVEGVLQTLSLKASTATVPGRKPNLTLDLTKAEVIAAVRTGGFDGLHLRGGTYRGGINFSDGKNLSIVGGTVLGTEARLFNGVGIQRVVGARVIGVTFRDCLNGVSVSECSEFEIAENDFERIRKDVINVFASQDWVIRDNKSRDHRPQNIGLTNADHPDGVQMFGAFGKPPVKRGLIQGNIFDIEHGQGITQTWKEGNGDPRFEDITYRGNRVKCGQSVGYGMIGVDGGLLEDNALEGYDSALYPTRFFIDPRCTDIVWKGENVQAAHKGQPAKSWPPTVAVAVPPPPTELEIARADLSAAVARAETAEASLEACRQIGDDLLARLTEASTRLDAVRAALA